MRNRVVREKKALVVVKSPRSLTRQKGEEMVLARRKIHGILDTREKLVKAGLLKPVSH